MYRHLLVPIDGTDLSVEVVGNAVALARPLGARITFFHASADHAASLRGEADAVRLTSRESYDYAFSGRPRELLAKAEAAARAFGVPCASMQTASDKPAQAIVGAAREAGCDLIFMASHGRRGIRGLMLGSETQKLLQHASVPVLVAAVESNIAGAACDAPLAIIRDEHRSIAAVIHGLEHIVREARSTGAAPSFPLLRAIARYVRAFPEALHHPKEDAYLFPRLRARTSECDATLAELEAQHVAGTMLVDAFERSVAAYEADPATGFAGFASAVAAYASSQMAHMALEAKVVIPAARQYLTADDWAQIGAAFGDNGDPRFSVDADEEYRHLFTRILNLAPAGVVGAAH